MVFRIVVGFMRGMATLPKPWWAWVGLLMFVNMVAPLAFLPAMEARVVLATFFLSAGLQMTIFARKGFVKLLGAGHAPWIPLCAWLASRISAIELASPFRVWITALLILNGLSLMMDLADVIRYGLGDRDAAYRLAPKEGASVAAGT